MREAGEDKKLSHRPMATFGREKLSFGKSLHQRCRALASKCRGQARPSGPSQAGQKERGCSAEANSPWEGYVARRAACSFTMNMKKAKGSRITEDQLGSSAKKKRG